MRGFIFRDQDGIGGCLYGTMYGRYIRLILEPQVVPFVPYTGLNFHLIYDNAHPHIAHVIVPNKILELNIT